MELSVSSDNSISILSFSDMRLALELSLVTSLFLDSSSLEFLAFSDKSIASVSKVRGNLTSFLPKLATLPELLFLWESLRTCSSSVSLVSFAEAFSFRGLRASFNFRSFRFLVSGLLVSLPVSVESSITTVVGSFSSCEWRFGFFVSRYLFLKPINWPDAWSP